MEILRTNDVFNFIYIYKKKEKKVFTARYHCPMFIFNLISVKIHPKLLYLIFNFKRYKFY